MSNLIVDTYNVYKKVQSKREDSITKFFEYIYSLKEKYKEKNVYYVFDGDNYYKKTLDQGYKINRKERKKNTDIKSIQNIILNTSNSFLVKNEVLEADDMAYCLCTQLDHSTCVSEDRDWLLNLTANEDIRIYQKGGIIHKLNFEQKKHYPLDKVPLAVFLEGDSKDGVKKPFRIKGSVVENTNKYSSIEDYCLKNGIPEEKISLYRKLIFPITHIPFQVMEGRKTGNTAALLAEHKLKFMKSQYRSDRRFVSRKTYKRYV